MSSHLPPRPHRRTVLAGGLAALAALSLAACASSGQAATAPTTAGASGASAAEAPELRLGYFANITHAIPLIGVANGTFASSLGGTKLTTQIFNAGPAAVEAIFGGGIDAAYIGPNPSINAFAKSDGEAIRIIAGATSGGAQLVVRDGITSVEDLRGTTIATPQLGNTQDVALRAWLRSNGLQTSVKGGQNDLDIVPQENAQTLDLFKQGALDGAWVPEPWASRLVLDGGAHVLVDEADLWPDAQFVTTNLVVRTEFLTQYPGTVAKLLEAQLATTDWIAAHDAEARTQANDAIEALTSKKLSQQVLDRAWSNLTITNDPVASSVQTSADHAAEVGVSGKVDLHGIYDLTPLNDILRAHGLPPVSAAVLGTE
ncbi:sulfonate ABC transporter substrate-binding protein (plasmid) [Cellulomonas sp. WB94]|uniref:ABC transporter substrate-binding protein n=1 Tax=Cellulomonas sp. WB94 TaxID=2173174 RepID=UPI000D58069D|nr:ABC transporter substrate-binding protein [Cellulomonas sp. WB94]PVU81766.1 sulfonate ABC transporter substrate-binding protein [Cellulomonas sp. WB94]